MAKYINRDIYLEKRGIDLNEEFRNVATDNPSNVVEIILQEAEDGVLEELAYYDNKNITFNEGIMQKVMIYQIDWLRQNGNLTRDSDFKGLGISRNGYKLLKASGYANHYTSGSRGYREVF